MQLSVNHSDKRAVAAQVFEGADVASTLQQSSPPAARNTFISNVSAYENTSNRMGVAWRTPARASQMFLDFLAQASRKETTPVALDVGAAFGTVTILALLHGARMYANDLSAHHLGELSARAAVQAATGLSRLELIEGSFPRATQELGEATLDAVHCAWVLHFMDGQEITAALQEIHRLLKPGGKVFGAVASLGGDEWPNLNAEYQRRAAAGIAFPGFFANTDLFDDWTYGGTRNASARFHFLDASTMRPALERANFLVEQCGRCPRPSTNAQSTQEKFDTDFVARKRA